MLDAKVPVGTVADITGSTHTIAVLTGSTHTIAVLTGSTPTIAASACLNAMTSALAQKVVTPRFSITSSNSTSMREPTEGVPFACQLTYGP